MRKFFYLYLCLRCWCWPYNKRQRNAECRKGRRARKRRVRDIEIDTVCGAMFGKNRKIENKQKHTEREKDRRNQISQVHYKTASVRVTAAIER